MVIDHVDPSDHGKDPRMASLFGSVVICQEAVSRLHADRLLAEVISWPLWITTTGFPGAGT